MVSRNEVVATEPSDILPSRALESLDGVEHGPADCWSALEGTTGWIASPKQRSPNNKSLFIVFLRGTSPSFHDGQARGFMSCSAAALAEMGIEFRSSPVICLGQQNLAGVVGEVPTMW
jgi:hypothetical protein